MCVVSRRAPSILVLTHSGRLTAYIRTAPSHPKTSLLLLLSDGSLASRPKERREKREKPGNKDCSVLVIIFSMAGVLLSELDLAHFSPFAYMQLQFGSFHLYYLFVVKSFGRVFGGQGVKVTLPYYSPMSAELCY